MTMVPHDQMGGPNANGEWADDRYGPVASGTPPNVAYVNESGMRDEEMEDFFNGRRGRLMRREIASVIEKWSQSLSNSTERVSLDVFNRHKWQGANHIFATMSQCAWAVENDDILSTLADVIEGLMWQKCRFELFDDDQQDMWNQWAGDVNLDARSAPDGPRGVQGLAVLRRPVVGAPKIYEVKDDSIEAVDQGVRGQGRRAGTRGQGQGARGRTSPRTRTCPDTSCRRRSLS